MRRIWLPLSLIATLAVVGPAEGSPADSKALVTTQRVDLRAKPGESAKVVGKLAPGANLKVLKRKGRWIKVRLEGSKVAGWLTRTTVRSPAKKARKAGPGSWGKRSLKRAKNQPGAAQSDAGVDDALKVVVVADEAHVFTRPSGSSRAVFSVRRDAELAVLGRAKRGRWLMVQDPDGRTGWIAATAVVDQAMMRTPKLGTAPPAKGERAGGWRSSSSSSSSSLSSSSVRSRARADRGPRSVVVPRKQPAARVTALFGYRATASDYSSDGSTGLGNYLVSAGLATAGLTAAAHRSVGPIQVHADASYLYGRSSPGIHYESQTSSADGDIAFSTHRLSAGLALGATLSDALGGTVLMARAGYVYSAFLTGEVDNVGLMASESLRAPTLGARLRVAPGSSWLVSFGGDLAIGAERSQTLGLEDGMAADASALWLTAVAHRRLSAGVDLTVLYTYDKSTTQWSGASARQADVTEADRRDSAHTVMLGLGAHI